MSEVLQKTYNQRLVKAFSRAGLSDSGELPECYEGFMVELKERIGEIAREDEPVFFELVEPESSVQRDSGDIRIIVKDASVDVSFRLRFRIFERGQRALLMPADEETKGILGVRNPDATFEVSAGGDEADAGADGASKASNTAVSLPWQRLRDAVYDNLATQVAQVIRERQLEKLIR